MQLKIRPNKLFLGLLGLIGLMIVAGLVIGNHNAHQVDHPPTDILQSQPVATNEAEQTELAGRDKSMNSTTGSPTTRSIQRDPRKAQIANVVFIEQAPLKNWDAVHEETCEEAAALTLVHFLKGEQSVDTTTQENELQKLVSWETEHLGTYEDTNVDQTAQILREYFNLSSRVRVIDHASLTDLKHEIALGHPVIVPAAGRLLHNRYFKRPGPIYHMVVAIGYTNGEIITNDPGTQHGQNYRYPTSTFWNAVHDFVDRTDEGMARGDKKLIVVDPN